MNIVYISKYTSLPEYENGTRHYFLAKYLARNNKEDNVLLIGSRSSLTQNIPPFEGLALEKKEDNLTTSILNGDIISLGFNFKRLKSWLQFEYNLWRYRKKIKEFKPDVIVVSSLSILTFLTGIYFKRKWKVPLALEVRDVYPLTLVEVGGYSKSHPAVKLLGWVEKIGYKYADLMISTLANAKSHFEKIAKKPIDFKWLPMGVDLEFYNNSNELQDTGFLIRESNEFIIGYAGTIGSANALDVVFNTAKNLEHSHPQIKFAFVGGGPLKDFYRNEFGKLTNVIFHDPVAKQDLLPLLQEMDVLINTWLDRPIYRFGISPNKWIDYMLAAKPILLTYSGYEKIMKEANCGYHIPAEDEQALTSTVIKLSETPKAELEQMGQNGKDYLLKRLQYKDLAKKLRTSLEEIIEKRDGF